VLFLTGILLISGGFVFWNCLPTPLFDAPFSTVLLDRDGKLLSASIAEDEQWRFPPITELPEKFTLAITYSEDKRFFRHIGVDPLAVGRALWQNIRSKRVVSGASTITMQVIRLSRQGQPRTLKEKLIEMVLALRLELSQSKKDILALYASYAPFGGNVVGIEAASWRYFGRGPEKLSWAETAMLAVLPNNPALIHPGRNRDELKQKRDNLLEKLHQFGVIDSLTCKLTKAEPLPPKPHPIPMLAPHLLARTQESRQESSRIKTTLKKELQTRATEIVQRHFKQLARNGIHNVATLILEVGSGDVLAYIGNISDFENPEHGNYVDIITAPRSTGSILKPFLYAGMMDAGELLPSQLVSDIPTRMGSFAPQNYSRSYQGAVPAYMALARSLNIPAVFILRSYGVDRFSALLKKLGMSTLHRPAYKYGLSLILGGAEGTLWDITGIYAAMARRLNNYSTLNPDKPAFFPPHYVKISPTPLLKKEEMENPLDASACWLTFEAMLEVVRPGEERAWRNFSSSQKIAWKTGTSYGYRDAWAVGVTPQYAVGVWVGNADGEGRPGLTGLTAAAPVLFELFGVLEPYGWFERPEADLVQINVCAKSGYRAGPDCAQTKTVWVTRTGLRSKRCPYCRIIHCDAQHKWQVHNECERVAAIDPVKWFVLPPAMEWYYKHNHSDYLPLPPYRTDCLDVIAGSKTATMTLIYPAPNSRIYVPIELDSRRGRTVFEAAHRNARRIIYWHLDEEYLGKTRDIHQIAIAPEPGEHTLTLVDEEGESLERKFTVLMK
jgi:penicillin-binding protein 1C